MPAERCTMSAEIVHRVVVQTVREPEAVAERRGDEPRPGGRPDEGEVGQFQPDGPSARPLPYDDVDLEVLHGRVEDLLDGAVEPVDLVDEEHVPLLQMGEDGGHVGLALQRRSRGGRDVHPHLQGDDVGESGLAQSRRSGQQHVVQRLTARLRRRDEYPQLLPEHRLSHERAERARAQGALQLLFERSLFGIGQSFVFRGHYALPTFTTSPAAGLRPCRPMPDG